MASVHFATNTELILLTDLPQPGTVATVSLPSKLSKLASGSASERLAAEHLQALGLTVVARNLRCRAGELDLVCLDGKVLAIVEVRQRVRGDFGGALASVNRSKQRKIIRATRFFWQRTPSWHARLMRFDVVGVEGLPDATHRIHWIKDAFRAT